MYLITYREIHHIFLLVHFVNKLGSSCDLTIFRISFISSFDIISVVIPDSKNFFYISAPVVDAATVNPNDIKTFLANGVSTGFIKSKLLFSNSPKSLHRNSPDCPPWCN